MKNSAVKTVLIFTILITFFGQLNAQSIDNTFKELVNTKNWFGLDKEFNLKKEV